MDEITNPILTARLSLDSDVSGNGSKSAKRLVELGFILLGNNGKAITLKGQKSLFEDVFSCRILKDGINYTFKGQPNFDTLPKEVKYRIYFPREVEYF